MSVYVRLIMAEPTNLTNYADQIQIVLFRTTVFCAVCFQILQKSTRTRVCFTFFRIRRVLQFSLLSLVTLRNVFISSSGRKAATDDKCVWVVNINADHTFISKLKGVKVCGYFHIFQNSKFGKAPADKNIFNSTS